MFTNKKIWVLSALGSLVASLTACNNEAQTTVRENKLKSEEQGDTAKAVWEVVDIGAKSASELLVKDPLITVLDIRTPAEFAEGHIKGAINVDFKSTGFEEALAKLDKSKKYLMHCRSGGRSGRALAAFKNQQFTKIYHLNHGINDWKKNGLPLEK